MSQEQIQINVRIAEDKRNKLIETVAEQLNVSVYELTMAFCVRYAINKLIEATYAGTNND